MAERGGVNRAERRARAREVERGEGTLDEIVRHALSITVQLDAPETQTVAVGPIVWRPRERGGRQWYFLFGSGDAAGEFHLDCLMTDGDDDRATAERLRRLLFAELAALGPGVIHDFEDELSFAEFCAALWPCERSQKAAANLRAEYAAR
jgi:hypothetical protein